MGATATILVLLGVCGACGVSIAEDSTTGVEETQGLEEIVVTAEKRESTVQHTALDIQVFNATKLQDSGVEDFSTLYKVAPNINVNSGGTGGIGQTVISINGIHPYNLTAVTQSPIAVNLDGLYIASMTGLTGMFYDLGRMEILAGPQGTLYGRNATGGAINVITNRPTHEFEASGEIEAGNYGETREEGALNLPLSDTFAVRIAGRDYQHRGYFSNGLNDAHEDGGRISALWNITPKATFSASADIENSNDHDAGLALLGVRNLSATQNAGGGYTVNPGPNVAVPSNPFTDTSVVYPYGLGNSTNNSEIWGTQGQLDYDLGFATLTGQVGYRHTEAYAAFLEAPSPLVTGAAGSQDFPTQTKQYSEEVRLSSASSTPVQWVAGLYGFTEDASGYICIQATYQNPVCVFKSGMANHEISYAGYVQGTYTPPVDDDKLHFVLGGRYNYDRVTSNDYEDAVFFPPPGYIDNNGLAKTGQKGTYKAGVNYDLTSENLLYFSNSTGYRAFNFQYGSNPYVPPETIKAWDIGSKNQFLDRRLQVNLDAFWYDYFGSERSEQTYPPAAAPYLPFGEITTFSAGHLRYQGASINIAAAITPVDRVSLAVQYIRARYIDFVVPNIFKNTLPENLQGIPTGQANGVFSGDPVSEVAPWAGSMDYEHDWHVFDGTITGKLSGQFASRTPETDADPGTISDIERPGYVEGDALLRYAPSSQKWAVSLWCRNFTNRIVATQEDYNATATNGLVTGTLNPPRTYGVTLSAKVGGT
jgi:iron complex outermembrane receptor protein